jgi:hypothetical protein
MEFPKNQHLYHKSQPMKTIKSTFILLLCGTFCTGQHLNNNDMIEKIDFDYLEKYAQKTTFKEGFFSSKTNHYNLQQVLNDGTEILIKGDTRIGFYEMRTPPSPAYWQEIKVYYPSGIIQENGKYFGAVKIGIWRYYNKKGKLIKEEDCDEKFGTFSHEQVFGLLTEKGLIGENGERLKRMSFDYKNNEHQWVILDYAYERGGAHTVVYADEYIIDGHFGTILNEEKYKPIMIPIVPRPKN